MRADFRAVDHRPPPWKNSSAVSRRGDAAPPQCDALPSAATHYAPPHLCLAPNPSSAARRLHDRCRRSTTRHRQAEHLPLTNQHGSVRRFRADAPARQQPIGDRHFFRAAPPPTPPTRPPQEPRPLRATPPHRNQNMRTSDHQPHPTAQPHISAHRSLTPSRLPAPPGRTHRTSQNPSTRRPEPATNSPTRRPPPEAAGLARPVHISPPRNQDAPVPTMEHLITSRRDRCRTSQWMTPSPSLVATFRAALAARPKVCGEQNHGIGSPWRATTTVNTSRTPWKKMDRHLFRAARRAGHHQHSSGTPHHFAPRHPRGTAARHPRGTAAVPSTRQWRTATSFAPRHRRNPPRTSECPVSKLGQHCAPP